MVDFKKLLFRTAGLSMLIKGITGVHGVSHLEEGNKNIPPITRKTQRPEPINFEKRLDLVQKLNQKGAQLDEVQQRRDNLRAEITQEREVVDKLAGNAGFNNMNSLDVLSDQDCFLNRVTLDDAKAYSAFSSLVYNIDQQKSMTRKASKQTTKLERDFLAKLSTISLLESKEAAIKKSLFITEEYKREVENLSSVFGIKFQTRADQASPTFEEVQEAIGLKVTALRREAETLERQKEHQNTEFLTAARDVFAHNLEGMDYNIEGVFHRNNGEFSGVAGYKHHKATAEQPEEHTLLLAMAGTKSWSDVWSDLWGVKDWVDYGSGLLRGVKFHAGIMSHLNDNAAAFFSFTTNWLKNFQEQHAGATLNIAGVGHSLGGSLGEVFAVSAKQIAEKMGIKVRLSIMTEGAPNIIDANSLETYNNIKGKGNTIQIAHVYDPVPRAAFWLKSTNDAEIKRANSLFYDINGTMVLPGLNPHSSTEYYQSAVKVFESWYEDMTLLKTQAAHFAELVKEEEATDQAIGKISREAYQIGTQIINQDKISAAGFEQEWEKYITQEQLKLQKLNDEFKPLKVKIYKLSLQKNPSIVEQEKLVFERTALQEKINKQTKIIEDLSQDKPWTPYAEEISRNFAELKADMLTSSFLLDSIVEKSMSSSLSNFDIGSILTKSTLKMDENRSIVGATRQDILPTIKAH
ncbi:MAG: hypothetical protein KA112_02245 [Alphaproteobacteria bacterium]|nr:hypothetical protein [Alphaproteobacteria bacterium]